MTVDSKNVEFGYELISALPYAYWLHENGQLKQTISGVDSECLYYFSPDHKINPEQRSFFNTKKAKVNPNIKIHTPNLDKSKFSPPPLKEKYANKTFKFKKETIVICNRHNREWKHAPINFFDLPTLEKLFELLQDKYQIVYINIEGVPDLYDNAPPEPFGDFNLVKKYRKVKDIHTIHKSHKHLTFNELQLKIFANCSKFITMNGGHSILASYFGGENIIMSKFGKPQSQELNPKTNSFYRWYNEFGDQRVLHVPDENKLFKKVKSLWIDKDPIVNILMRTSGRPKHFDTAVNSVINQEYENLNIFCSTDNDEDKYIIPYPIYPVKVTTEKKVTPRNVGGEYGIMFPYNLYLNELHKKVKSGLIIYLDDDNKLDNNVIEEIVAEYKKGNELIFWKIQNLERIIPKDENFLNAPVCCDIDSLCFAFDSKYKDLAEWEPYKRGDFRVVNKLYHNIEAKSWINKILARTQNGAHAGKMKEIDLNKKVFFKTRNGYCYKQYAPLKKWVRKGVIKVVHENEIPPEIVKKLKKR